MKKALSEATHFLLLCLLVSACTIDYDVDIPSSSINKLVLSACLETESPIICKFYTCKSNDKYDPAKEVNVTLKEDGQIIYQGIINQGELKLDYLPKAGKKYTILAQSDGFMEISAETKIPPLLTCKPGFDQEKSMVTLSDFSEKHNGNSLWITASSLHEQDITVQYQELYSYNRLIDNVNREEGSYVNNNIAITGFYKSFIRIEKTNVPLLDELQFVPFYEQKVSEKMTGIEIDIINASNEYDQYCRTYYQALSIPSSGDLSGMFFQPSTVYSNVNNGLGIFAGRSVTKYLFSITNQSDNKQ